MKKLVLGSVVLALSLGFSGCAKSQAAVKSAITGKTLKGSHYRGWDIELTNNSDGTFALNNKSQNRVIKGTWRMDGNKYCNKSNGSEMRKGREGCFTVYNDGGKLNFLNNSGALAFSIK